MENENATGATEQEQGTQEQEQNPFAGFQTESYDQGERSEAQDGDEEPTEEAPAAEPASESDEDDGEEQAPQPPRRKPTAQERIDELTRARRQAERETETLRRQLEEMRRPQREEPQAPPAQEAAQQATQAPPNPDDFQFGELDSQYIAALVDYQTEQRLAKYEVQREQRREAEAALARQQAAQEKFHQQMDAGRQKYADFEDVVVRGAQEGAWPLSETLGELLVQSDVGDDIAYHLATNPDEAAQVFRQAPTEQARYFGRMEAQFSAARSAATGKTGKEIAPARTPKAPPPVTPARGAGGRFQVSADTDDFSAFESVAMERK